MDHLEFYKQTNRINRDYIFSGHTAIQHNDWINEEYKKYNDLHVELWGTVTDVTSNNFGREHYIELESKYSNNDREKIAFTGNANDLLKLKKGQALCVFLQVHIYKFNDYYSLHLNSTTDKFDIDLGAVYLNEYNRKVREAEDEIKRKENLKVIIYIGLLLLASLVLLHIGKVI